MLCPFCGTYGDSDDVTCPSCGKLLPRGENRDTGVMAIRQGRRAREEAKSGEIPIWQRRQGTDRVWIDPDTRPTSDGKIPVYPDPDIFEADGTPATDASEIERNLTRAVYGDSDEREVWQQNETPLIRSRRGHPMRKHGFNWMIVLLAAGVLLIAGVITGIWWLRNTDGGKDFMIRHGYEVEDSEAYWRVGNAYMDNGDLEGAIDMFLKAWALEADEEDGRVSIDGLLQLATAYMRTDQNSRAEEIFVHIYTDLNPSDSRAYTREITLLRDSGRDAEAAELMQLAYQKTGSATFNRQRNQLLPSEPITLTTAGSPFDQKRTMYLTSPEDFDIYYVMNNPDAQLFDENRNINPEWIHYDPEAGIFLDEGSWSLRAVCVNGDLASDELSATYRVDLPSPHQPMCGLAPGTYTARVVTVALWPNPEDGDEPITIYYTVDGTIPDSDSPVYQQGNKIRLNARNITLRALAVNSYGKQSTVLERTFKIEKMPDPPKGYATNYPADIASIRLNNTSYDAFAAEFGAGDRSEDVEIDRLGICRRYHYTWGYATFQQVAGTRYIVELYSTANALQYPRSTRIGMTEREIVTKFRDLGQVESPSGNRGLYSNGDGTGKIMMQADGSKIIRYIAYTPDSHYWQLDYNLNRQGTVESIYQRFIP